VVVDVKNGEVTFRKKSGNGKASSDGEKTGRSERTRA
jgi:hypothetical protein